MSKQTVYQIIPHIKNVGRQWKIEKVSEPSDQERSTLRIFLTRHEAIDYGKILAAENSPSKLIINEVSGRPEKEIVY